MYRTSLSQDTPKRYNGKGRVNGTDDRARSRLQGDYKLGTRFHLVLQGRSLILIAHQTNLGYGVIKIAVGVVNSHGEFSLKSKFNWRDRDITIFDLSKLLGVESSSLLQRFKDFASDNPCEMRIKSRQQRKKERLYDKRKAAKKYSFRAC